MEIEQPEDPRLGLLACFVMREVEAVDAGSIGSHRFPAVIRNKVRRVRQGQVEHVRGQLEKCGGISLLDILVRR